MAESLEDERRIGSAMSIHMAVINQEASEHSLDEHKASKPRRSASKLRQRKANKIKLPKLSAVWKDERDHSGQPMIFKRRPVECLEARIDIPLLSEGLTLHHCSDPLLEESIRDSSLKQDLKVSSHWIMIVYNILSPLSTSMHSR